MTKQNRLAISGSFGTFLAFVPWIFYWVLAGIGRTTIAILLGLGISLAINGYRLAIRKMKLVDTVTLVFLAVAAFVTLVLHSDFLVFYGSVLSDTTLALMAWGSLVVGNPFTYDYAKEDWDEVFWENPIFVRTNQILTAVWGVIFTLQALSGVLSMAMHLEGTARVLLVAIVPRSLLAVGIFLSVWFPRWYPQRATAQQRTGDSSTIPDGITGMQLIEFMPLSFNAEAAGDVQAAIQYYLSGDGGGAGYLEIASGRCTFHPGEVERPTLTIKSSAEVWLAIARGELNGAEAFLDGDYRTEGDMRVLLRLEQMFGG